jgi:uncharacterized protein YbbK (DUF523 family)
MVQEKGKPVILVSACLLGEASRYDGSHKLHAGIAEFFGRNATLVSLCPEQGAGLGTPRPPIRLVEENSNLLAIGVHHSRLDVTEQLTEFCQHAAGEVGTIHGCILKCRSPSCGSGTTPIHHANGNIGRYGDGLFTQALRSHFPGIPVSSEEELETAQQREAFLQRCRQWMERKG